LHAALLNDYRLKGGGLRPGTWDLNGISSHVHDHDDTTPKNYPSPDIAGGIGASLGNLKTPMTDAQLEAKFRDQAVVALPADQVERLIDRSWRIEELEDAGSPVADAVPAVSSQS
jgi:hypothetical protein